MRKFFEQYGDVILIGVVIFALVVMTTPLGEITLDFIKNAFTSLSGKLPV